MVWLTQILTKYPELAVYLALGIGYGIGSLKFRGFSLGGATGSLLAGILIGILVKVPVAGMARNVLFLLFMFGIGYSVGPKFFKAMKGAGWRFGVLGAFVPVVGLLTAWGVASLLKLDLGFAGGLVSGALTESPAIGTASEAIQALALPDETKHKLISHVAVADALCYVFGAFGVIYVCGTLGTEAAGHRPSGRGREGRGRIRCRAHESGHRLRVATVRGAGLPAGPGSSRGRQRSGPRRETRARCAAVRATHPTRYGAAEPEAGHSAPGRRPAGGQRAAGSAG